MQDFNIIIYKEQTMTGKQIRSRFDLWMQGIRIFVDGTELNIFDDTAKLARQGFYDDKLVEVYHESYKNKSRSKMLTPKLNVTKHEKGINKECKYMMIGFGAWGYDKNKSHSISMPYHRLLYIWFYDDLEPKLDIGHINGQSLDNRLSNLAKMTRKENLAMRTGAVNQYGRKKKLRETSDSRGI